jgi:hypothetical protein
MEVERQKKQIVANVNREEVFDVQAGNIIGSRPGVTLPDAKFEILPLSRFEPDESLKDQWSIDRLEIAEKAQLKGVLFSDGDLQIAIPAIKLTDCRITTARLSRELIKTPGIKDRKFKRHMIPPHGVLINFTGTVKTINIHSFFV